MDLDLIKIDGADLIEVKHDDGDIKDPEPVSQATGFDLFASITPRTILIVVSHQRMLSST